MNIKFIPRTFTINKLMVSLYVIFVIYMFSADYILTQVIHVSGESKNHPTILIPDETGKIVSYVDGIETTKVSWKDLLAIRGWAFVEGKDAKNNNLYLVIKSDLKTYIYDSKPVYRPDVTEYFYDQKVNLNNSGFEALIPLDVLTNNKDYHLGVFIKRSKNSYFSMTGFTISVDDKGMATLTKR